VRDDNSTGTSGGRSSLAAPTTPLPLTWHDKTVAGPQLESWSATVERIGIALYGARRLMQGDRASINEARAVIELCSGAAVDLSNDIWNEGTDGETVEP
jgi:hypothetical protein